MHPIQINSLTKHYKLPDKTEKTAVESLTLSVNEATVFGFLGPNGAGKTTTIKIILNFMDPTSGSVNIFGMPSSNPESRKNIGYLPEQPYFPKFLKPLEVVKLHAELSGISGTDAERSAMEAIELSGILEYAKTPISKLSKGLTQRVGIAQALVGKPKLLILDEPTSGLDPIGRRHTRNILNYLKSEGVTIFLSSHVLSEIEEICDNVAIMKSGKLLTSGVPKDICHQEPIIEIKTQSLPRTISLKLELLQVETVNTGEWSLLRVAPNHLLKALHVLNDSMIFPIEVNSQQESLEEAFIRLAA